MDRIDSQVLDKFITIPGEAINGLTLEEIKVDRERSNFEKLRCAGCKKSVGYLYHQTKNPTSIHSDELKPIAFLSPKYLLVMDQLCKSAMTIS